jgi:hypothetical protein
LADHCVLLSGAGKNFLKNQLISRQKRERRPSTAKWSSDRPQGDQSVALPQPPPDETPFDTIFQEVQTQDIFWERIADDDF